MQLFEGRLLGGCPLKMPKIVPKIVPKIRETGNPEIGVARCYSARRLASIIPEIGKNHVASLLKMPKIRETGNPEIGVARCYSARRLASIIPEIGKNHVASLLKLPEMDASDHFPPYVHPILTPEPPHLAPKTRFSGPAGP